MDDLIIRQAVLGYIDRVLTIGTGKKKSLDFVRKYIETLPSAQLIQCKECVYGNKMKDTIRCELMDYLPVECDHFCSWAERRQDEE